MTESDRALGLSLSPSSGLHALRSVFKRFVRIVFKPLRPVFMPFAMDCILKPFANVDSGRKF